jgi:ABC-type multidrug transport system ATPase subunit
VEALKAEGVTFLVAGQNARVMERFCTRAVVIADGGVVLDGTVAEALALVGRGTLEDDDEETVDDGADVLDTDRDDWRAD